MRILAVIGSLRNGNTKYLVEKTINSLDQNIIKGVDFRTIHLKNITMSFCNGCLICDETGTCFYDDDMTDIANKVRTVDGFVFASPARWSLMSGELKVFFDRLNPLAINEELKGKKSIIITVGQSNSDDVSSIQLAAKSINDFCDNAGIIVVNTVTIPNCYGKNDAAADKQNVNKCIKAVSDLINHINNG